MKKIILLLMVILSSWHINAQVSSYSFVAGTGGVLDPMTASTQLVASGSDDGVSPVTNIGFTFNYAGIDYTQFSVNANGNVRLGATTVTSQWTNTAANADLTSPVIMVYWDDLATGSAAGGGKVHSVLTGTAPNRKLIIEWFVTIPRNTSGAANAKFQCVLNETTNVIEFVYGTGVVTNTDNSGYTIGLATSGTIFNTVDSSTNTVSQAVFKNDNTIAIPDGTTYTWTPPSCQGSTGLTVNSVTVDEATITWTPPSTVPASGYEYVISSSPTAPTGAGTAATTNTATATGLTSNTVYYVFVRSNCGSSFGSWVAVGSFITACNPFGSFTENFDSTPVDELTNCWSSIVNSTSTYADVSVIFDWNSQSNAVELYNSGDANAELYLITPNLTDLSNGTHRLKFRMQGGNGYTLFVGTMTDPTDSSTFTEVEPLLAPSGWNEYIINFSSVVTTDGYIALKHGLGGTYRSIYIDNVVWESVPACPEPQYLNASSVTSNSAELSWTENGTSALWNIEYGISGFTQGSGTVVLGVTTNPYTLTGLTPTTSYSYYVQSDCASPNGTSIWSGPFTFTTLCGAYIPTYTQNFTTFPPNCWSAANAGAPSTGPTGPITTGIDFDSNLWEENGFANNGDFDGSVSVNLYGEDLRGWLISPSFNLSLGGYEVKYDVAATEYGDVLPAVVGSDHRVRFLISTNGGTTWTALETYDVNNVPTVTSTTKIYNLTTTSSNVVFAFFARDGVDDSKDWELFIDNFQVRSTPTCPEPINLTASNITGNAAAIGWTSDASAVSWEVEYGLIGFTLGTGTIVQTATNPFTLTGLMPNTTYQFYVRSICAGSETSINSFAGSFTTSCATYVPNYIQNFTAFPPDCWSAANAGDPSTGPTGSITTGTAFDSNLWEENGFANNGDFSGAVSVNLYGEDLRGWLISPTFDLSLGGYQVKYDVAATEYGDVLPAVVGSDHRVRFLISINGGTTWTALETYDVNNVPTVTSTTKTYNLTTTSSNVVFAFFARDGVDDSKDWELFIDNFQVRSIPNPNCPEPTVLYASSVTLNSADLGWTENGTATAWDIEWGANGFTPTGTPNIVGTTINPHNLTGLTTNTSYSFYVRANCGGSNGESIWVGPFNFTTPCNATNVPYVMDFESAIVPAFPNCTAQQNVGTGNLWTVENNPGYGFTTKALVYEYNETNAANVWFYTQGINLTGGTTYAISFDYGCSSSFFTEKLKVAYGTSASASAMTNPLADFPNIVNNTPLNNVVQFTPSATGVYYFGFNAYSVANQFNLLVDNINVDVFLRTNTYANESFSAYPNPVKDVLNLSYNTDITSVQVVNLLGQEVLSRKIGNTSTQLDLSNLTAGAYIVNVTVDNVVKSIKVIKQ